MSDLVMSRTEMVAWFVGVLLVAADVLLAVELLHRRSSSGVTARATTLAPARGGPVHPPRYLPPRPLPS